MNPDLVQFSMDLGRNVLPFAISLFRNINANSINNSYPNHQTQFQNENGENDQNSSIRQSQDKNKSNIEPGK